MKDAIQSNFALVVAGRDRTNYLLVKEAKIIAMTCTHAALRRHDMVQLGFKVNSHQLVTGRFYCCTLNAFETPGMKWKACQTTLKLKVFIQRGASPGAG